MMNESRYLFNGMGVAVGSGYDASGIQAHPRGWNTGVRVSGYDSDGQDAFNVCISGGSSGGRWGVGLATIEEMRDGSVRIRLGDRFGGRLYDLLDGKLDG